MEGEYAQDYHWCFIDVKSKMWARILEYRVYFNINEPDKSRFELFSFKMVLFRKVYPGLSNHLTPYFNEDNEIDGT